MLKEVIHAHFQVMKKGGFLVINIDDILAFADENMPRIQAVNKAKLRGYKQKHFPKKSYRTGQEMYAAHGSIMIFTKNYFNLGASIYYPRFLFGEEVFVAEETKLKGLKTVYFSELRIYDNEHGSTSREADHFISKEHVKSYKYLLQNYFNLR